MYTIVNTPEHSTTTSLEKLLQESPYTLLYFYPRDNTPGCTTESIDFTKLQKDFKALDIQVIGVSKDSEESHCSFQTKHNLKIPLISDPDRTLHEQFGARGEKNMYGKIIQGVIRSTFLLDQKGTILHQRKSIRAKGHAKKALIRAQENL